MSSSPLNADAALKQAQLETDDRLYTLIHLPANGIMAAAGVLAQIAEPFAALIIDRHEVTLIMPEVYLEGFAERLRDHRRDAASYRLITFNIALDSALVGFMARISAALAAAGVSILPLAAFERDHILVRSEQFDTAMTALRQLQESL
jgi:hypothetical protein